MIRSLMVQIISFVHVISHSNTHFLIWLIVYFDHFILIYNVLITPLKHTHTHTPYTHTRNLSPKPICLLSLPLHFQDSPFFILIVTCLNKAICVTLDWSYLLEFGGVNQCKHNWNQWFSLYLDLTIRTVQEWESRALETLLQFMLDC